jgi:hypothetical protein
LKKRSDSLTKAALSSFAHKTEYQDVYTPHSPVGDPYKMPVGGPNRPNQTEDIRWLLE